MIIRDKIDRGKADGHGRQQDVFYPVSFQFVEFFLLELFQLVPYKLYDQKEQIRDIYGMEDAGFRAIAP